MNKKERVCDVDNIVEWRHVITILLAFIVVSGRAQTSFDTGDGCLNVSLRNFSHKNLVSFVSIL